jgi:hypothetical protein
MKILKEKSLVMKTIDVRSSIIVNGKKEVRDEEEKEFTEVKKIWQCQELL